MKIRNDSNSNQNSLQSEETIQEIFKSLDKLDKGYDVSPPDIHWFENQVIENQIIIRKRLQKEILLFLTFALFILCGVMFTILKMPILFYLIQTVTIIFIILYSGVYRFKRVNDT